MLPGLAVLAAGDELARERAGFEPAVLGVADGGRPGIFAVRDRWCSSAPAWSCGRTDAGRPARRTRRASMSSRVNDWSISLVGVGLAVIDAALHDHRGVAALDGRLVVLVLVRQVAPA